MTITRKVSPHSGIYNNDASSATIVLAYSTAPTAGSLLVCVAACYGTGSGINSCADDVDGAWTAVAASVRRTGNVAIRMFYLPGASNTGGARTVTVTLNATQGYRRLMLLEYAGVQAASPLESGLSAILAGGPPDPGDFTPSVDGMLLLVWGSNNAAATFTPDTGFAEISGSNIDGWLSMVEEIQTTKTNRSTFWTYPTANATGAAGGTFLAAAGGASVEAVGADGLVLGETAAARADHVAAGADGAKLGDTAGATVVSPTTQTHYRWRNDDGDEAGATWAALEDTPDTLSLAGAQKRLRVQLEAAGNPSEWPYKLQMRKAGTSDAWRDVDVT